MNYTMAQVTHLTGIQAHTLRVWERRYDFIKAKRKTSKFRYYTEEQLRKLLNTAILIKQGYRISSITKLTDEQINDHVENVFAKSDELQSEKVKALVLSMLLMKESSFNRIFDTSVALIGFIRTFEEIIYPFLTMIGGLWVYNKANPSHEHFISNLIRQKIIAAVENLDIPANGARCIVLLLLEGDDHELGLLLGSYIAKAAGWKVIYLGARVPADDVASVIKLTRAELVFSTFTIPNPNKQQALVSAVRTLPAVKLLLAGPAAVLANLPKDDQILHLDSPQALGNALRSH